MQFGLAIECDGSSKQVLSILSELEAAVSSALAKRQYGAGLDHLYLGVVLLSKPWDGHERRPFKFEKESAVRSPFGTTEILNNVASLDVIVDPQLLTGAPSDQRRILARAIRAAFDQIREQRAVLPDLQIDELCRDVAQAMGD